MVLIIVLSSALAIIFFYFMNRDHQVEGEAEKEEGGRRFHIINSPIIGELLKLEEVPDSDFSSGVLGEGIAIRPYKGEVTAPADGIVEKFFPEGNAVGFAADTGEKLLIHVGTGTGGLRGQYFRPAVRQGQRVEKGQPLLYFDIEKIEKAGYSLVTPVVVTNGMDYRRILEIGEEEKEND